MVNVVWLGKKRTRGLLLQKEAFLPCPFIQIFISTNSDEEQTNTMKHVEKEAEIIGDNFLKHLSELSNEGGQEHKCII